MRPGIEHCSMGESVAGVFFLAKAHSFAPRVAVSERISS